MDEDLIGAVRLEPRELYDRCLLGKSETSDEGSVLVYSYEKLVEETAKDCADKPEVSESDWIDAVEFVNYNTIRGIAYMGDRRPLGVYDTIDLTEEWDTEGNLERRSTKDG